MSAAAARLGVWSTAGWVVLALGAGAAALVDPLAASPWCWAPLLASLVVLGVPHGAVDHHVADRLAPLTARAAQARRRRVVALYALAVLLGVGLWWLAPLPTLAAFLVVSAVHWGQGDGWWAVRVAGRAPFGSPARAAVWIGARGALPIAGAALVHPGEARRVTAAIVERLAPGTVVPALGPVAQAAGLAALGLLVLAAAGVAVADHRDAGRPGLPRRELAELAGLAAFFALTPAAWAVGLYFLAWHAPRHVARLVCASPAQAALLAQGRHAAALWSFHREALACTAVALAALAALAALSATDSADAVSGAALAAIAALTFPHVAVVAWMDARQGVWRRPVVPAARATGTAGAPELSATRR